MSNVPARFIVLEGPSPDQEYELTQSRTTIGRAPNNDIVINDPEVSRRHAQILRHGSGYTIEDLGSTNGTFVNEQRVAGLAALNHNDIVTFGEAATFRFLYPIDDEQVTVIEPDFDDELPEEEPEWEEPEPAQPYFSQPAQPARPAAVRVSEPSPYAPPRGEPAVSDQRRLLLGCGCAFLFLLFLCAATLFFLDAYDQGRLLYCGPLRPLFELTLGPFGFAPLCP